MASVKRVSDSTAKLPVRSTLISPRIAYTKPKIAISIPVPHRIWLNLRVFSLRSILLDVSSLILDLFQAQLSKWSLMCQD
jgi:hypothetical protein